MDLLAIGETMMLVAPAPGQRLDLESTFALSPGGAESNVAIHAARLGLRTAWLSRLGNDRFGELILDAIASWGVDVSLVERIDQAPTAVYFKSPQADGTEVIYYRAGSAAATMSVDCLQRARELKPSVVLVSGITPALSSTCFELINQVVIDRWFGDALVAFDVNYRPRLWPSRERAAEVLLALAGAADIVFVGRDEAEALWGTATAEQIRTILPAVGQLVIKDGGELATEYAGEQVTSVPAGRVEVIEPVGAGDAFAAGWLTALLQHHDSEQRLRVGHASAAAALRTTSDQADDLSESLRLLSNQGSS